MKRRTGLMAAMLALLLLFAGCAANKNNATSSDESMSERPQMAVEGSGEAAYDASYGLSASPEEVKQADDAQALYGGRKVIVTYDIRLETDGFDALIAALKERLTAMGGYVQNSYIDGKEPEFYGDSGRTATLSLRVPAEKAEAFFSDLKTMGNVQSERVYTDDVTTAYFDKETRLSVLNTQLERLENILVQTDNLADVLALEEEIARVMLEIESLTGELRRYDALIEYGVEPKNIGTDQIYITANYDYSQDVPQLIGYEASNMISVQTTDIESVGDLIDLAFEAGANELNGVNFSASNTEEAKQQALTLAVQNAMTKAQTLADAAGVGIGPILSIEEQQSSSYYGADAGAAYMNMRDEAESASTLVQASTIQVSASVAMEFEMGADG